MATDPAGALAAITPHDSTSISEFRGIYVGVGGDVVVVPPGSGAAAVTFKNAPSGGILPVRGVRVNSTNTTATNMVALY
jgi:hypothetical protein